MGCRQYGAFSADLLVLAMEAAKAAHHVLGVKSTESISMASELDWLWLRE
jgi:hypothetical protein